ncbi:hypothetical protein UK23_35380 [Lentzea aerocolonigenes]|uniref:Uncharacterized protein n=1 Tax=Lentzea aerocolonigenes TaxID=68170 RepID=A0A0F0GHK3_LENAE|nr:hypothetical protein [Lentzea aerocolonigenes]KJK42870.1 hypothetical protein UK23_35380 [Lentzea aerocolonigenes]
MRKMITVRHVLTAACAAGWIYGWGQMMHAATSNIYFEPTDDAIAQAAAALPMGFAGAGVVAATSLVAAALLRRPWIAVGATPGLVAAVLLLPGIRKDALPLLGILASTLMLLIFCVVRLVRRNLHPSRLAEPHS